MLKPAVDQRPKLRPRKLWDPLKRRPVCHGHEGRFLPAASLGLLPQGKQLACERGSLYNRRAFGPPSLHPQERTPRGRFRNSHSPPPRAPALAVLWGPSFSSMWLWLSKPFWDPILGYRCTTHFRTYFSRDWDVHLRVWPCEFRRGSLAFGLTNHPVANVEWLCCPDSQPRKQNRSAFSSELSA